jgi:hypothetical protein
MVSCGSGPGFPRPWRDVLVGASLAPKQIQLLFSRSVGLPSASPCRVLELPTPTGLAALLPSIKSRTNPTRVRQPTVRRPESESARAQRGRREPGCEQPCPRVAHEPDPQGPVQNAGNCSSLAALAGAWSCQGPIRGLHGAGRCRATRCGCSGGLTGLASVSRTWLDFLRYLGIRRPDAACCPHPDAVFQKMARSGRI